MPILSISLMTAVSTARRTSKAVDHGLGRYFSKFLWLFVSIFGICLALVTKNDSGIQDHELSHLKEIKILELLPYFVDAAIKLRQSKLEQVNWTCMNFKTFPVFSFCLFPKGTLRRDNFFFFWTKEETIFLKNTACFVIRA